MDAIYDRRSIRKYKIQEVPEELLLKILEAGRCAPSGKNRQPWKFIVFGGKQKDELLEAMEEGIRREKWEEALLPESRTGIPDAENTLRIMQEAPIIIIILNTNGKHPFQPITSEERVAEIVDSLSIGAAVENMLLRAQELGLGTLWIANTFFAYRELVYYLETEYQLAGAVALGYADEMPLPRPRKSLSAITEFRLSC